MNRHVKRYYSEFSEENPQGRFHRVISLHESPDFSWDRISQMVPSLPKGWFELSSFEKNDRLEFTKEYWLSTLPYHPKLTTALNHFFSSVEEIGVFVLQKSYGDSFEVELVYSLEGNRGFFRGSPPCGKDYLIQLQKRFSEFVFPKDYLAFLQIHNGFAKSTDTGILKCEEVPEVYEEFQALISQHAPIVTSTGELIDITTLIPFYESFGMPCFQCFWGEWFPEEEMGNVYYSGLTQNIPALEAEAPTPENMAFHSFSDWLIFYLDKIA